MSKALDLLKELEEDYTRHDVCAFLDNVADGNCKKGCPGANVDPRAECPYFYPGQDWSSHDWGIVPVILQ